MAWDIEMIFSDPDSKEELPFLITSGQYIPRGVESEATTGEVVGLFIRDRKTRQLIEDKNPIILEIFARILGEVDEISTVCSFTSLWKEHYNGQNMKRLEQDAWTILHSKYASESQKKEAKDALEYALEKQRAYKEKQKAKIANTQDPGFVYVLRADNGLFKIGKAKTIGDRVKQLAVSLPYELEIICTVESENYTDMEINLHRQFAEKRVRGEWFELEPEDIEYIRDLA